MAENGVLGAMVVVNVGGSVATTVDEIDDNVSVNVTTSGNGNSVGVGTSDSGTGCGVEKFWVHAPNTRVQQRSVFESLLMSVSPIHFVLYSS